MDLATMEQVKSGQVAEETPPEVDDGNAVALPWSADDFTVRLAAEPAPDALQVPTGELSYDSDIKPGTSGSPTLTCRAAYTDGDQFPAPPRTNCPGPLPHCAARTATGRDRCLTAPRHAVARPVLPGTGRPVTSAAVGDGGALTWCFAGKCALTWEDSSR